MTLDERLRLMLRRAPDDGAGGGNGQGNDGGDSQGGDGGDSQAGDDQGGDGGKTKIPKSGGKQQPDGLLDHMDRKLSMSKKAGGAGQGDDSQGGDGQGGDDSQAGDDGEGDKGKAKAGAPYKNKVLEKNEHLLGKSDEETIENLTKAFQGLRKQLGEKGEGAPETAEEYTFETKDLPIEIDPEGNDRDKAVMDIARQVAHGSGLSQGQFQGFLETFIGKVEEAGLIEKPPSGEELEAAAVQEFGDVAVFEQAVGTILTWGRGLMEAGELSQDEYNEFKIAGGTPQGLRMLMKLRGMTGELPIPPVPVPGGGVETVSTDRIDAWMADPRYNPGPKFDPKFREEIDAKIDRFADMTAKKRA